MPGTAWLFSAAPIGSVGTSCKSNLGWYHASIVVFGKTGLPYFRHNTGVETYGVTGDLFGIAEAGVAYLSQMDKDANLGLAGSFNSSSVMSSVDITPTATNAHNLGAAGRNWGCLYYDSGTLGNLRFRPEAEGVDNRSQLR